MRRLGRRRQVERLRIAPASGDVSEMRASSIESDDEARQLHQAMRRLGADQRAILSLRYWEDMNVAEISAVLDVPQGTVKSRLNQARSELKEILERNFT
jgi:RNA polymerase sigma-70 factor (ECF subfamily)